MGDPKKKMSKADYEKLKAAFGKSLKDKSQLNAARVLKKELDDKLANEENDKRRGVKPSRFPMYRAGGKMEMKEYKMGGKIYKDGGRALFEALKKKFGEG